LYRQNADGTFTDVAQQAGFASNGIYGMCVAVCDYDNDGYPDIYVTGFPHNTLYHNNGDGTFADVTDKAGVAASGWSTSAAFFDYNRDGYLDLFVGRYLDWDYSKEVFCGERRPGYRDRKSTRLNSSHGSISYAVFCLKKKKQSFRHRSE